MGSLAEWRPPVKRPHDPHIGGSNDSLPGNDGAVAAIVVALIFIGIVLVIAS